MTQSSTLCTPDAGAQLGLREHARVGERRMVEVPGGPIEVDVTLGDDDLAALVFLHEGLGSIDLWRDFPAMVRDAVGDRPMIVYSRHGHGRSAPARRPRPPTYMHHEAEVVLPALRAALGLDRVVLIGHSDGGSIALIHAGGGHAVEAVVSLAAHVFVEEESIAGISDVRTTFETTDLADRMARHHDDAVATFRGWSDVWLSDGFRDWDIEAELGGVTAPVLAVQGTADEYGTVAQADAIERGVAGHVTRLVLDGIGHVPQRDAPESVIPAIVELLGRTVRQRWINPPK